MHGLRESHETCRSGQPGRNNSGAGTDSSAHFRACAVVNCRGLQSQRAAIITDALAEAFASVVEALSGTGGCSKTPNVSIAFERGEAVVLVGGGRGVSQGQQQ